MDSENAKPAGPAQTGAAAGTPTTKAAPTRAKYNYQDRYDEGDPPPDVPPTDPIFNKGSRTGRNEPCWCGSGKKYKKCHLGKEPPT